MKEINLFKAYLAVPQQKRDLVRKVRVVMIVALALYCLSLAGVFSYWLILKRQASTLSEKIENQRQKISRYQKVETLHVLVKQRLAALTPVLSSKTPGYHQILDELESIAPEGVVFTNFDFTTEGGFKCSAEAPNAVILAIFLERFLDLKNSVLPDNIDLSSVTRSKDGEYSFALTFNAKE